jgi:hypothetical protein
MLDIILPTIGSSGYFELKAPFSSIILPNERYTCQAIRRLSDLLANNETPKEDIYLANGISEAEYDDDILKDMYIISLQGQIGHWIYVPARYVIKYPIVNGIPYRTMMMGISLPPMPVKRDLTFLTNEVKNLLHDTLGVDVKIKFIETSKVVLVSKDKHDINQLAREAISNGKSTDRSRLTVMQGLLNDALLKIKALEDYIKLNLS